MATLPQLIEEDVAELNRVLRELLDKSDAGTALILDKGGFVITKGGDADRFDVMTLAALAAASFAATESIAGIVGERNFSSIYQQGESFSLLVMNIDDYSLLALIFKATISVGAVKYFAAETIKAIAAQMKIASERAPGEGFDLSELNLADAAPLFQRRTG